MKIRKRTNCLKNVKSWFYAAFAQAISIPAFDSAALHRLIGWSLSLSAMQSAQVGLSPATAQGTPLASPDARLRIVNRKYVCDTPRMRIRVRGRFGRI